MIERCLLAAFFYNFYSITNIIYTFAEPTSAAFDIPIHDTIKDINKMTLYSS